MGIRTVRTEGDECSSQGVQASKVCKFKNKNFNRGYV